jgi:hypothetical protein
VAVVISSDSVKSPWVKREIDVALNFEIYGKPIKVLPILKEKCELPSFLVGKLYADFTDESNFEDSARRLIESIGVVFNKNSLHRKFHGKNLGDAIDIASRYNLPIFRSPLHRPFQYLGMTRMETEKAVGNIANQNGSIVFNEQNCEVLIETEGNFVSYIEIAILATKPHYQNQDFDSIPILGAFSINPSELEVASVQTHFHKYWDHRRKIQICVSCNYDGGSLSISFGSKYYGIK